MNSRSIKYWGILAEKNIFYIMLFSLVFLAYYKFMGSGSAGETFGNICKGYVRVSTVGTFMVSVMSLKGNINQVLAFGSLRKEAFLGVEFYTAISVVQCVFIYLILGLLTHNYGITKLNTVEMVLMYIGMLLIAHATAQIISDISMNKGRGSILTGSIATALIVAAFIAMIVIYMGMCFDSVFTENAVLFGNINIIAGIVCYAVAVYFNFSGIKKYDVKQS